MKLVRIESKAQMADLMQGDGLLIEFNTGQIAYYLHKNATPPNVNEKVMFIKSPDIKICIDEYVKGNSVAVDIYLVKREVAL